MATTEGERPQLGRSPWIALVIGVIAFAGIFWAIAKFGGIATEQTCESLVPEVISISKDNAGFGAKVLDVVEVKTMTSQTPGLSCEGLAILSSGFKQKITFKHYEEYGKWWVRFDPEGLPFN